MLLNNLEKFEAKIKSGKIAYGACISLADPTVTELAADAGFDFCWIDMEHGVMTDSDLMKHIMTLRGTNCAPIVRVAANTHTHIKKVIDLVPAGIIAPMINTAEEAEAMVDACRFPMDGGSRGCGFRRANAFGLWSTDEFFKASKTDPWVIPQIEHIDAVRNLDSILKVKGIASICIGPYDLSASMGKPGQFDDAEVKSAIEEICAKTLKAGIVLGAYGEDIPLWKMRGVQWLSVTNDIFAMAKKFKEILSTAEQ